jgi:hypothetical protein
MDAFASKRDVGTLEMFRVLWDSSGVKFAAEMVPDAAALGLNSVTCVMASCLIKQSEYIIEKETKALASDTDAKVEYRLLVQHKSEADATVLERFTVSNDSETSRELFIRLTREPVFAISEFGIAFENGRCNKQEWLSGKPFNDQSSAADKAEKGQSCSGDFTRKGKDKQKKKRLQKHQAKQDGYAKGREFSMGR